MKRLVKAGTIILVSLIGLIVVILMAFYALRIYQQHMTAEAIAIQTTDGIDEGMYVKIGGIDQ